MEIRIIIIGKIKRIIMKYNIHKEMNRVNKECKNNKATT